MRLICLVRSSWPRPQSSTPALLLTAVRFFVPLRFTASMSVSGMPQRPKPPTSSLLPSAISATASSAVQMRSFFEMFAVAWAGRTSGRGEECAHPPGRHNAPSGAHAGGRREPATQGAGEWGQRPTGMPRQDGWRTHDTLDKGGHVEIDKCRLHNV